MATESEGLERPCKTQLYVICVFGCCWVSEGTCLRLHVEPHRVLERFSGYELGAARVSLSHVRLGGLRMPSNTRETLGIHRSSSIQPGSW